ncbi:hypothetical protein WDW86_22120 [Bdellovibrionota bacterium FG-2]
MILGFFSALFTIGLLGISNNSFATESYAKITLEPMVRVGDPGTEGWCNGYGYKQGDACTMWQLSAEKFCANQNLRLPTARELALILNPSGVSETDDNDGSYLVSLRGEESFYYNYRTYRRSARDDGKNEFWSSSTNFVEFSHNCISFTGDGYVGLSVHCLTKLAVRCVSRQ